MEESKMVNEIEQAEERRRRVKILTVLLLLLLLALLALIFLYFLIFYPGRVPFAPRKPVEFLFSIYGLNRPLGVSTDKDNNIYVSDTGNERVLVFDSGGDYVRRIGTEKKPTKLFAVYGSVVDDKNGRIYIADWTFRVIHVFNLKGKFLYRFPKASFGPNYGPLGFTPYDIDLYKGKMYITSNDGILVFSPKGKFLQRWGHKGREIGFYDFPNGLVIDKKRGVIYVADVLNRRVVALTPKGNVLWVAGKPDVEGRIVSYFGLPRGIAIDSKGLIYVTDTFNARIVVLNRKGELVSLVGSRGTKDAQFNFPDGIAITNDGVIYIADRANDRVQAIRINQLFPPPKAELDKYGQSFFKVKKGVAK